MSAVVMETEAPSIYRRRNYSTAFSSASPFWPIAHCVYLHLYTLPEGDDTGLCIAILPFHSEKTFTVLIRHQTLPVLISLMLKCFVCSHMVSNNVLYYVKLIHITLTMLQLVLLLDFECFFCLSVQYCHSSAVIWGTFCTHASQSNCNTLSKTSHHAPLLFYFRCSSLF